MVLNEILCDRVQGGVTIVPVPQQKTLTHLPKRPPVDIEFTDLQYTVPDGSKSEY